MFIEENDLVELEIRYIKNEHQYNAYTPKEFSLLKVKEDGVKEEDKLEYLSLIIKMKELSWGMNNQLHEDALVGSGENQKWNHKIFKENKLVNLITEWDAKDKNGNEVPINAQAISNIAPPIAEAILRAYDEATIISEEEKGK